MERLSPEEPCHALVLSAAEAVQQKPNDDGLLRKYRKLFLTIPTTIELAPVGDPRVWRAINLREDIVEKHDIMARTLMQRVYEVAGFKLDKEVELNTTFSSQKTAALYNKNVKYAKTAERVSESFVDTSLTVFNRVLVIPECKEVLDWCDSNLPSSSHPFKSVYSFQAIIDRASTPENIKEALVSMLDGYRMEYLTLGNFAVKKLKDPRESFVNVTNLRLQLKPQLLNDWLKTLDLKPEVAKKAVEIFTDVKSVRLNWSPYDDGNSGSIDTTFLASMPASTQGLFDFLEGMLYGSEFISRCRDCVKTRGTIHDLLEYHSIKSKMKEIEDAVRTESTPPGVGQPGRPGAGTASTTTTTTPPSAGNSGGTATAGVGGQGDNQAGTDDDPLSTEAHKKFNKLSADDQVHWRRFIWKTIHSGVKFISQEHFFIPLP